MRSARSATRSRRSRSASRIGGISKKAKEDLDEANAELGKMLDQFERDEQDRLARDRATGSGRGRGSSGGHDARALRVGAGAS
jgi:hypothetical protein